jgi:outer membrane receptor protein involved in Fe transport
MLSAATAIVGMSFSPAVIAAAADVPVYQFNINPEPLGLALRQLSNTADLQIIFAEDLVRNLSSPALQGSYTADEALKLLLAGSGLIAARAPSGTIMVRREEQKTSEAPGAGLSRVAMQAARADVPAKALPQTPILEEIVVTGTRITRNGYEAPTPVTVLNPEEFQASAARNIADVVNALPTFVGSTVAANSGGNVSSGTAGINALNLRDLGANRTLILLDGERSVPANLTGLIDINLLPQALVSRVDVVTGGASSAYGSDALAGVVNFVLDKNFAGIKGEISGGATDYGDDRTGQFELTAGTSFADGRGHIEVNGEVFHNGGVIIPNRPWNLQGWQFITNPTYTPTNGQPYQLLYNHVGLTYPSGGIIADGPLMGIAFGPQGAPYKFQYGSIVSQPDMVGGAWQASQIRGTTGSSLDPDQHRENAFARVSYDLTDDINLFAQFAWAHSKSVNQCCPIENTADITVSAGNPFIPTEVAAQMVALGLTSITIGTMNADLPIGYTYNDRRVNRNVVGAHGKLEAFDIDWTWDAYYQNGVSRTHEQATPNENTVNAALAIDAVINPANSQTVCRSTLTNPNNGCVPYNVFGIGVNTPAAIAYVGGQGHPDFRDQRFVENVQAFNVSGEPFSNWAGPISIALGAEHRSEAVSGINDPISPTLNWWDGDFLVTHGSYTVTEGFLETVVPLARNSWWAKQLDVNAAIRATDYSTSGYVTTWKVGLEYAPIDGARFRFTRSRDIRAPNMSELFAAGGGTQGAVVDPFNKNATEQYHGNGRGNPALRPEESDTTGAGVVLQPSFVPGLSASIDYWNYHISNAIGTTDAQNIVDFCYQGFAAFCGAITRTNGVITAILTEPFNLATQSANGIDFEASYVQSLRQIVPAWDGNLSFRFIATTYIHNISNNGTTVPIDLVGNNAAGGVPNWRWSASVAYAFDPVNVTLTGRGVSSGNYGNNYILCTSGCPPSTGTNPTTNYDYIPGAVYVDASVSYKLMHKSDRSPADLEVFFNVKNLFNKDPALVASGPGGFGFDHAGVNEGLYDILGRVYLAGVRFKM